MLELLQTTGHCCFPSKLQIVLSDASGCCQGGSMASVTSLPSDLYSWVQFPSDLSKKSNYPSCNQSNLLCSLIPDVSITNVRMAPMVFMSSSSTQREPTVGRLRSRSIKRCFLMLITGFPVSILRKEPRSRVTMDDAGLEGKGGRGWFLRIGKTMESKSKRQEPSDSCQPVHKVRH